MITRRNALQLVALTVGAAMTGGVVANAGDALQWAYFQGDESGFRRTPVLVSGRTEAVLIDAGFTYEHGRKIAEAIKATGKKLTTIYISCNDPDYYFNLKEIKAQFPDAKVIAHPDTVAAINANVAGKIEVWAEQLKENGPQSMSDIVLPEASDVKQLTVDGQAIDIVNIESLHDRRYLWVPSLEAVFGGVLVYSGIHVWVADSATEESRSNWIKALDDLIARNPKILIPGHQSEDAAQGVAAAKFTRDYLVAFDEEAAKAKDSAELIAAMTKRYPDLKDVSSLELGAKVAKGEMKWG